MKRLLLTLILLLLSACGDADKVMIPKNGVILAFGDSLTQGVGAKAHQSYPSILENTLSTRVINAGISGETSLDGLKRIDDLLLEHQPDLIILCFGGNDILRRQSRDKLKHNLMLMIEKSKQAGSEIILLGVPEPGLFLSSLPLYKELADQHNLIYDLTILPDLLADNQMKSDTVHLNAKGYAKLAKAVAGKVETY